MRGGARGAEDAGRTGGGAGRQSAGAVFVAFLMLGPTSFGGPVAHIGYFREAFVAGYGAAQALPGPLFTFAA